MVSILSLIGSHDLREVLLYFAHRRLSVKNQHKETFHSHLGIEILYIHQGRGTMIVNNTRYEIIPGMICVFQPYQLHHVQLDYSDNQSFERSIAIFEPTMFEAYFESWPALHAFFRYICQSKLPSPCIYEIRDPLELESVFQGMQQRILALSQGDKLEEISLFLVALFRCLKREWQMQKEQPAPFQSRKNHQTEHMLSWIEAHYTKPFHLEAMAKELHLSTYHLSHLFKESIGMTISEYIGTRRAHQAVKLLTTTDKPIALIAEEVGITNSSYFCKLFKSHIGATPHQYRKRWGK